MSDLPSTGRQLRTEVTSAGELKLNLVDVPTAAPKPEQVVVRVEASPINPSDLGLLLGMADVTTAKQVGSDDNPAISAEVPAGILPHLKARWDESMPVGNEAGGVVIAAGDSPEAQALLGKTVGVLVAQCTVNIAPYMLASVWLCMTALHPARAHPASLIRLLRWAWLRP